MYSLNFSLYKFTENEENKTAHVGTAPEKKVLKEKVEKKPEEPK